MRITAFAALLFASHCFAHTLTLSWDPSSDVINGYRVVWGSVEGQWTGSQDVGLALSAEIAVADEALGFPVFYSVVSYWGEYGVDSLDSLPATSLCLVAAEVSFEESVDQQNWTTIFSTFKVDHLPQKFYRGRYSKP